MSVTRGSLGPKLMAPGDVLALLDSLKMAVSSGAESVRLNVHRSDTYPALLEVVAVYTPASDQRVRVVGTPYTETCDHAPNECAIAESVSDAAQ